MWPLNIRLGPPPEPSRMPSTLARPSSTCCHCTCRPISRNVSRMSSAIACSSPVKLGDADRRGSPISTSRSRSIRDGSVAHARTCGSTFSPNSRICSWRFVAPELEHDVRAARGAVLLDRRDAVVGRAGDRLAAVEDRVGDLGLRGQPAALLHRLGDRRGSPRGRSRARSSSVSAEPWMFCTLLARYMPAISRAPSRPAVAVGRVDRGDDRAADVDRGRVAARLLGAVLDVAERVAHEVGRRDRRRQQAVADLAAELLHQRRRAGDVDRHVPARHVRLGRERRDVGREHLAVVLEALAAEDAAHDLDRVAHVRERLRHLRRAALLRVVEEDLRRAEAGDEAARAGGLLHERARPSRPAPDGACRAR